MQDHEALDKGLKTDVSTSLILLDQDQQTYLAYGRLLVLASQVISTDIDLAIMARKQMYEIIQKGREI